MAQKFNRHEALWDLASPRALLEEGGLDRLDVRDCRFRGRLRPLYDNVIRVPRRLQGRSDSVVLLHLYGVGRKHG